VSPIPDLLYLFAGIPHYPAYPVKYTGRHVCGGQAQNAHPELNRTVTDVVDVGFKRKNLHQVNWYKNTKARSTGPALCHHYGCMIYLLLYCGRRPIRSRRSFCITSYFFA
jgi:hypothetical protein